MKRWESEEAILARINRMALRRVKRRRRHALARWRRRLAEFIAGELFVDGLKRRAEFLRFIHLDGVVERQGASWSPHAMADWIFKFLVRARARRCQ